MNDTQTNLELNRITRAMWQAFHAWHDGTASREEYDRLKSEYDALYEAQEQRRQNARAMV